MNRLLTYQLRYALKTRSFRWIIFAVGFFSVISVLLLKFGDNLISQMPGMDMIETSGEQMEKPIMYGVVALISGLGDTLITLIPILISIYVSSDFANGTVKNILARGYSRPQFYVSKLLVSMIVATVLMVVSAGLQSLLSSAIWGFSSRTIDCSRLFLVLGVKILAFYALVSICVFLSFLFGRATGLAVAGNIVVIRFLPTLLTSLALMMKLEANAFSKYEISTMITSLADLSASNQLLIRVFLLSVIDVFLSTMVGMGLFARRDL